MIVYIIHVVIHTAVLHHVISMTSDKKLEKQNIDMSIFRIQISRYIEYRSVDIGFLCRHFMFLVGNNASAIFGKPRTRRKK